MASTIVRNADVIWRRIEEKIILIGKDGLEIHTLNKTAALIWELCDGANGDDEITAKLCERFDVLPEEAMVDVRETVSKLEKMGLLERRR
jgi:hypothetical protein